MDNLTRFEPPSSSAPAQYVPSFSAEPERQAADYLRIARRRWIYIPICALAFAALAFVVSLVQPPKYQSTAEVLIQTPASATAAAGPSSQFQALASMLGMAGTSDIATQAEVMTSDDAMSEVAKENNLQVIPQDLRAHFTIDPSKNSGEIIDIAATAVKPKLAANMIRSLVSVYNKTMSDESSTVVGRMAKSTQVELAQIGTELDAAELAKSKYTKSIGSIDPTAKATQDVTQLYTLQGELLDAKKEQAGAVALQNYYNGQMKILDPSIVPNLAFQTNPRIDADKQQLATLEQQRIVMSAQYTPSDSQMIANQSQIDAIKSQMAAERKQESSNFAFKLPGSGQQVTAPAESYVVTSGTQELNPLREDARAKLSEQQATIDADQVEVKTLSSALGSLQSDVHTTPDSIMNMTDLTANIDVYRTIYSDLQGQNAQLEARLPAEQSYAKFLQQPLPPKKMLSPQPALYTIAGAIFGLFIGCILALVVDSGDVRMRDAKDAEMLFGRPLLQSFAGTKRLEQSVSVGDDPEPYHELACTLGYLGVGRTLRSILLTSAVKDEGSAQIASNLAIALSKEGRRVVLIDANVRKPILHVLFGQENNEGLAGLMRNGAKPDHALVEIAGSSTLSIIPGGESGESDDPRDMLNAEKFAFILNSLREQADIVLIDAPAVFAGYETSVIADKVDGIIFVSRSKFTSRATARKAFDLLSNCQAPIIGTVLAGTKE